MNILIVVTGDHQQYQVPRRVRCPDRGGHQVHAEPAAHGGAGQLREGRQKSLRLPVNRRPDGEVRGAPLRGLPELPVPGGHRQRQHPRDKVRHTVTWLSSHRGVQVHENLQEQPRREAAVPRPGQIPLAHRHLWG